MRLKTELTVKFLAMLIIMSLTIGIVAVAFSYTVFKSATGALYADMTREASFSGGNNVPWDSVNKWLTDGKDADYDIMSDKIVRDLRGSKVLFFVVCRAEERGMRYIIDYTSANSELPEININNREIGHLIPWTSEDIPKSVYRRMIAGDLIIPPYVEHLYSHIGHPRVMSAPVGFKDSTGATAGYAVAFFKIDDIAAVHSRFLLMLSFFIFLTSASFCALYVFIARREFFSLLPEPQKLTEYKEIKNDR